MFTQGLDPNALRWVREGTENSKKEMPNSGSSFRNRFDSYSNIGLPPPSKFRSGNLSSVIPSRGDVDDSGPDDDLTSESDGRYSLDSSPQDDRIPNARSVYSDEVSSSRETFRRRDGGVVRGPSRYVVHGEDESSDSVSSSEFSRVGSVNGGMHTRVRVSEGYASSFSNRAEGSVKDFKDDIASAPPIFSRGEIKQQTEQIPSPSPMKSYSPHVETQQEDKTYKHDQPVRSASADGVAPSGPVSARLPTFRASAQGPWYGVIAYEACVRLCLQAWAKQCVEAPMFLENECAILREAFGLQHVLLQSEEELMVKRTAEVASEGAAPKPKKMVGKMKVQVRKVKMVVDPPPGCNLSTIRVPKIKMEALLHQFYNIQLKFSSGWRALRRVHFSPRVPPNGSLSRQSLAYVEASAQYVKQVSGLLKVGVKTLRSSSSAYEAAEAEIYSCFLRLKSASEDDAVRMQPGTGETHLFLPDSLGDDLIVEVQDAKGKVYGRVLVQMAAIAEDPSDKLKWWRICREPEHELVGRLQLHINYSTSMDENSHLKCGVVAETVAYDFVLEVAMKEQHFQERNLLLHGPWKWLLTEFASYYGVSDAYSRLRYLSYIMDVATPTADCLKLVYELLYPVIMKGHSRSTLSHQENRILGEIVDQINKILSHLFENYKSLDESAHSGVSDVFKPASGFAAPALGHAVKLYSLLHDIFSPEAQTKLYSYFQAAAKKRSKRHLTETDEFVASSEGVLVDSVTMSTAYQKMKYFCLNIRNEIFTDIELHKQEVLPSFIDLPNLSSAIYSVELCNRLRAFLETCPPAGPSPPVTELVIATADLQRDLASWNIKGVKGGIDAKELFHLYIKQWIEDKRISLLDTCKLDKVKWSGVRTQHSTTPFVDEIYDRLKATLRDYSVIICRWPEYTFILEKAIADVEKAIVEALDKQYADVLCPLKENMAPKMFGLKYMQKLTKRSVSPYVVPDELGILLNSMKRMLDTLRPQIEQQIKSWGACIPEGGNTAPGDRLSEITVMVRSNFRNYLQAVVEKLAENTKLHNTTKLKKILQDSKESVVESDIRGRMQPLKEQLTSTINHLHTIFETHVFISICRGYWDRMGQDVLTFLLNRKENRSWYKGCRIAVSILEDTFASQMQQILGNSLQEKDLDPPKNITEVRSILCRDAPAHKGNTPYYY